MATSCALYNPAISRAVRVNWDGYPERMLPLLNTHWCRLAKEEELLALWSRGEIRSLGSEIVTTEWYGNEQVFCICSAAVLFEEAAVDYVYRYLADKDVWEVVV